MNLPDHRPVHSALIPWVVALVALFAWNAAAPDHPLAKKCDSLKETGLSQLTDNDQTPGRISNPLLFLTPATSAGIGLLDLPSLIPFTESHRDLPMLPSVGGAVRGRAPPGTPHA